MGAVAKCVLTTAFFAYVHHNINQAYLIKLLRVNELEQYKDMFDCLQEGIVVIEEKSQSKDSEVLFCNDIADRIASKILNL